jgi:aminoglycoside phosphotransferase (APT) family kinase protein
LLGRIHARLHETTPAKLPALKPILERGIADVKELSEAEKTRIKDLLAGLPDGDRPYHGDFHAGNVILREQAEPVIIDWGCSAVRDPMADVARTPIMLALGWVRLPLPIQRELAALVTGWQLRAYAGAYAAHSAADLARADRWSCVIAAARMGELRTPPPRAVRFLLGKIRSGLAEA